MLRRLTYEQWLKNNPDMQAQHDQEEDTIFEGDWYTIDAWLECPDCRGVSGNDDDCWMCEGRGHIQPTMQAYLAQLKADDESERAYYGMFGYKRCRCGRWCKQLLRMRWHKGEFCPWCFEQLAHALHEEALDANYDRHYLWGQGL